jgi:hypothetical protein
MTRMSDLDVPDGMALTCQLCGWRPGTGLHMGVVTAHFETEHDSDDVRLKLVVLCPRCDKPMTFVRSERRDIFACDPCRRIRTIRIHGRKA